ncbi:MAG: hypothetical protein IKR18_11280 [Bacteroidaceae bacterium]|nr:hypothetical protein [Bacteroidaceae bacterium]
MKKILAILAAVMMVANANAYNTRLQDDKYDLNFNSTRLCKYLGVSGSEIDEISEISDLFVAEMTKAEKAPEALRANRVKEAVYGNLKLMRKYLTKEQYHKYVTVMNVTLKNKGLDVYIND